MIYPLEPEEKLLEVVLDVVHKVCHLSSCPWTPSRIYSLVLRLSFAFLAVGFAALLDRRPLLLYIELPHLAIVVAPLYSRF